MDHDRRRFLQLGGAAVGAAFTTTVKAAGGPVAVPAVAGSGDEPLRLATFVPAAGGAPRIGVVRQNRAVIDLAVAARARRVHLNFNPADMISLIAAGPDAVKRVRDCAASSGHYELDKIQLLAPIPQPARNVYAVGWNYLDHFEESPTAKQAVLPKVPVFFSKATHTVNGPYDSIPFNPAVSTQIDWEGELAIILGKRGRNIAEADAMSHVFGYAVINDTTARDIQVDHGGQWFKGKSLDGHGPLGPWIVVAEDVNYDDLHLVTRVNGVVKQDANTNQMYFKTPRIVQELSVGLTLEAGDIIASGTPSGTGVARKPQEFLKPGDILETEIDRIGTIRNEIRLTQT